VSKVHGHSTFSDIQENEHRLRGEEVSYNRNPFARIFEKHDGRNGGHPPEYKGPEEALKYSRNW
jgi:hypothetical protein